MKEKEKEKGYFYIAPVLYHLPPLSAAKRGGPIRDEREGLLAVLAVWGLLAWLVPEGGQPPIVET